MHQLRKLWRWALAVAAVAVAAPLVAASFDNRTIAIHNIHTNETLTIEYKRNGTYIPDAMEKINHVMRDWRRNETIKMDPALIDLLWEVHNELGSQQPIDLICGYRSRGTNEMLRRTVGGQASESRHIMGKAADVQFPDVPLKRLRYAGLVHERGGVGYYPTSALPFVHLDTDRVRAWPRLPRVELALLFPTGRTQHMPADGGPLTAEDARAARSRGGDLVVQVAEFFSVRDANLRGGTAIAQAKLPPVVTGAARPATQTVAALAPKPAVKLVTEPHLVDRPSRLIPGPADADRAKLAQLASLAMEAPKLLIGPTPVLRSKSPLPVPDRNAQLGSGGGVGPKLAALPPDPLAQVMTDAGPQTTWAVSAAYDDDHPDELDYRPFPIAPFMTETASPDDPSLAVMSHPDAARTLDLLDNEGAVPPMALRPGRQVVRLMWAQEFRGPAVAADLHLGAEEPARSAAPADRKVKTSTQ
jgi:uncharacterized protein YcbK (DUF882 family)